VAISALFSNQIAAFFTTPGVLLVLWLISMPSQVAGATGGNLLTYLDITGALLCNSVSGSDRFE
jgi:hypothetical protein